MLEQSQSWSGRSVLVTGCNGFLGSSVTRELLDRQAHVVGLMREKRDADFASESDAGLFRVIQGRLEDSARIYSLLAIHEVSAVFHLAAETVEPVASGNSLAIQRKKLDLGTAAIMRAALLYNPQMPVIVARPSVQLRLLGSDKSVPHGIARFGELFGPGDRAMSHFIPQAISNLLAGLRTLSGEGPSRDYVFVRDAARACLSLAEVIGSGSGPLDISFQSGWAFTDSEMAGLIGDLYAGRKTELASTESPINPLGWQPATSLSTAVTETLNWYRKYSLAQPSTIRSPDPLRKAA